MSQLPGPAHQPDPPESAGPPDLATAAPVPQDPGSPVAKPSRGRLMLGVALGAGLAALGGLILGEYPFTGLMPYIAGVLFALVVAEVIVSVTNRSGPLIAVAAATCTVGGLGWGVWISAGKGIDPVPIGGWVALVIGAVVALYRGGIRVGGRPAGSSQPTS